jgi:hypothetical protein
MATRSQQPPGFRIRRRLSALPIAAAAVVLASTTATTTEAFRAAPPPPPPPPSSFLAGGARLVDLRRPRGRTAGGCRTLAMYFDDVSRHHVVSWDPAGSGGGGGKSFASSAAAAAPPASPSKPAGADAAAGGAFFAAYHPRPEGSSAAGKTVRAKTEADGSSGAVRSVLGGSSRRQLEVPSPPPPPPPSSVLGFPSFAEQRRDAIRRMVLGYDASSASLLSREEGTMTGTAVVGC